MRARARARAGVCVCSFVSSQALLRAASLGAALLLVFLVPTTLIFHTVPIDPAFFMNLALIGALILAITRSTSAAVPNFRDVRARDGMKALR